MPRIAIIGHGRAGASFAAALTTVGFTVIEVLGRGDDCTSATADVDAVLIATPDAAIAQVASTLSINPSCVVLHLSGAQTLATLAKHPRRGSIHPLVPLPNESIGAARLLGGATFAVAGDPLARIRAGFVDALLAATFGGCLGLSASSLGLPAQEALGLCNGAALLLWVCRDGLAPGNNRSPGKALFKLELCTREGLPLSPAAALCRNAHFLLLLAAPLHPMGAVALEAALFFDVATCAFTPDARKVGDYALGCRVVEERPGRAERLRDAAEAAEMEALAGRIRAAAPGLLEAEGLVAKPWYENVSFEALKFVKETPEAVPLLTNKPASPAKGGGKLAPPIFSEMLK